jgi:TatD DNase family protein
MPDPAAVFTDTHAHLGHVRERAGLEGLEAVLRAYRGAPVSAPGSPEAETGAPFIVDIGTEPGDLAWRVRDFGGEGFVRFTVGLWPGKRSLEDAGRALRLLVQDLDSGRCCALGECGLDYHHMEASRDEQIRFFEAQVRLAVDRGLPLIVHTRDAFEDTRMVVEGVAGTIPVIIHCFGYGPEQAERFLAAGCHVSFAGNITYRKAEALVEALRAVPAERLLLETDSPYMNPVPRRGRPSTPLDISRTLEFAAASRAVPVGTLADQLAKNAVRIFGNRASQS